MKAGLRAAAAWFGRSRKQDERPRRPRAASGTQVRCSYCIEGTRSCVYCFGHGHTIAQDGVSVQCAPCAGQGMIRCPACKGEAYVRGY